MKTMTVAAMGAAMLMADPPPAAAAELQRDPPTAAPQVASFVGARIRVPIGATGEKAHAGLALTGVQRSGDTGTLRFARGMELGFAGDDKVRLSVSGRPVSELRQGGGGPDGRKLGLSTVAWVGIGVAVVAIGGALWFVDAMNDASE